MILAFITLHVLLASGSIAGNPATPTSHPVLSHQQKYLDSWFDSQARFDSTVTEFWVDQGIVWHDRVRMPDHVTLPPRAEPDWSTLPRVLEADGFRLQSYEYSIVSIATAGATASVAYCIRLISQLGQETVVGEGRGLTTWVRLEGGEWRILSDMLQAHAYAKPDRELPPLSPSAIISGGSEKQR